MKIEYTPAAKKELSKLNKPIQEKKIKNTLLKFLGWKIHGLAEKHLFPILQDSGGIE